MNILHLCGFLVVSVGGSILAAADPVLTVDEAIELALIHNERAEMAREHLTQADGARREAWAQFLPHLTATGSYNRTRDLGNFDLGSVGLTMKLLDPTSFPQLREALALYEANRLDATELKRALAFDVAEAFAGVLAAEHLVEAAEKRLSVNDEALKQAQLNVAAGLVARSEVTRTEVEQATAAGGLVRIRATVTRTRLALGFLLGVPLTRTLVDPVLPQGEPPAVQDLVKEAAQTRLDLRSLGKRTEAAEQVARQPVMDTLPKLSLQGTASNGIYLGGADEAVRNPVDQPAWTMSLVASWSIYDGGARYGRKERYASLARESRLSSSLAYRRMEVDIVAALADLATAQASLSTAEIQVRAALQNQSEIHARFSNGLATAIEEADATARAFEASANLTSSRYALWQSYLAIHRSVGRWPTGAAPARIRNDPTNGK